jgi:type I restriction enzyme M protein
MVYKKCREQPNDILFIDASRDFEKVKTQNKLREADIDKIVATYAHRGEMDKYSRRATLAEIAANDYNLNIPRYVDTFEAEATIDIADIAQQLKSLNADLKANEAELAVFCGELGIDTPF